MISRRDFLKGIAIAAIPIPLYPAPCEEIVKANIPKGQWGQDTYQLIIRNDGRYCIIGAATKDTIAIKINGDVVASYSNLNGDGAQVTSIRVLHAGDIVHWTGNGIIPRRCGAFHMHREQWRLLYEG